MKFKSSLLSQASGSLAGLVFQHGRGGTSIKARSMPVNKRSAGQNVRRAAFSKLLHFWSLTIPPPANQIKFMNSTLRKEWKNYADHVNGPTSLGRTPHLTGRDHFIRCNLPRQLYWSDKTVIIVPPKQLNLGSPPELTNIDGQFNANGNLSLSFDLTMQEPPASFNVNNFIFIRASAPCMASVTTRRRPYLYHQDYSLNDVPSWPWHYELTIGWNTWNFDPNFGPYNFAAAGCRVFCMAQVSRSDGRLSMPQHFSIISPTHS
jgi:hypothetical protein